jgi:hypothetical protein
MDSIRIRILEDGTIRIETDAVSQANHMSAEQLLRDVAAACGGESTRQRKSAAHTHHHAHDHAHH